MTLDKIVIDGVEYTIGAQIDLSDYYKKSETYSKTEIDAMLIDGDSASYGTNS